jgi:RNA polymerase sigma-70 factor (ECF subfamily)
MTPPHPLASVPTPADAPDAAPRPDAPDPLRALVVAAAGGDRDATVRLLSLVAPPVTAAIRALLGPRSVDLDDAVQEALLAVTASLDRFRGESTFLHYARRIAVRTALALRRSRELGARKVAEAFAEPPPPVEPPDVLPRERERRLEALLSLLDELPEGQAECLAYRVLLEVPLPQIAREVGVPVNTVRSRVRLARNHLRDRILGDPALAETLLVTPRAEDAE